jgi:hypothetical protein
MSSKTRFVAFALVLTLTAAGAAQALPRDGRPAIANSQPAGLFDTVWSWFATLFAPSGGSGLTAVWGQDGAGMDPNGATADAGPEMDPNGAPHALTTAPSDGGGMMDPNG